MANGKWQMRIAITIARVRAIAIAKTIAMATGTGTGTGTGTETETETETDTDASIQIDFNDLCLYKVIVEMTKSIETCESKGMTFVIFELKICFCRKDVNDE
jgi:hypothetical protein